MVDVSSYCRELEHYLCQKNDGHLIRVVGPAFELVSAWAAQGIPLKIAYRGVDRCFERYYAKGPRRRPVRIEFCAADVLDAFDEWRRAVGVSLTGSGEAATQKPTLPAHIERVVARLTVLRGGAGRSAAFDAAIENAVRELDRLAGEARSARGDGRTAILERLGAMDRELLAAALAELPPSTAADLKREAESELAPFGARMTPDARERALAAAFHRLVRESRGVPTVTFE